MATPIELLQGALAKLQVLEQVAKQQEQRIRVLEQQVAALANSEDSGGVAGGIPT